MSNRSDWERQKQEYSMYSLFSTKERAQKHARRKQENARGQTPGETRTAGSTGSGNRPAFQRPVGSSQPYAERPVHNRSAASPKTGGPQSDRSGGKPNTGETHRYRVRHANRAPGRPIYEAKKGAPARHDSEALFMVKKGNGKKVLVRDTDVSDLHAVRVPPKLEITTYKAKTHSFPLGTLLTLMLVTVMIMTMIYSYVKKSELTSDNSAKDDELAELKSKEEDLSLQIVKRSDLKDIEEKAENDLGMIKNDRQERQYVAIEGHDHAEILVDEEEEDIPVQTVILQ